MTSVSQTVSLIPYTNVTDSSWHEYGKYDLVDLQALLLIWLGTEEVIDLQSLARQKQNQFWFK